MRHSVEQGNQFSDQETYGGLNGALTGLFLRLEKRGSAVMTIYASLLLHVGLLAILWLLQNDLEPPAPGQTMPIVMQLVAPPDPASSAAASQAVPEVRRTSPNPSENPTPEEPAVEPENHNEEEQPEPEPEKLPHVPETPRNERKPGTPIDDKTFEKWTRELERDETEARKTTSKVKTASTIVVEAPGVERPYVSKGADVGTVRELDIARYPMHMQERFIRRYKIRIRRNVPAPRVQRSSWVNQATTHEGTYRNAGASTGRCDIMTLSHEVQYRMVELELAEITKRRMVPERTRVHEIVFGLRENKRGQVDLYVTRFRATPIQ